MEGVVEKLYVHQRITINSACAWNSTLARPAMSSGESTFRKRASPTLVVRGSVRVVAAGASRLVSFSAADLRLSDVAAWQTLRHTLDYRHEGRRRQLRFRRDPQAYLASLEPRLLRSSLPS